MSTGSHRDREPQIFDEVGQVIAEVLRVARAQAHEIRRSAEEPGERVRARQIASGSIARLVPQKR